VTRQAAQSRLDRLPPHHLESEMCLLGCVVLEPKILDEIRLSGITPEHFYSEGHEKIFRAMTDCFDRRHGAVDLVLLEDSLNRMDTLQDVGGMDYALDIAKTTPSAASWEYYAAIVTEKYKIRRAIDALGTAIHEITQPDADFDIVMPGICDRLSEIAADSGSEQVFRSGDVARTLAERIKSGEKPPVIPSGFRTLDKMLKGGGFRRGQSVGIGGRPANGKSMLGANLVVNVSEQGFKSAFISLEMDPEEIVERWMAFYGYSETDAQSELKHLELAVEMMDSHNIPIIDIPNSELGNIRSHIRSLKRKHGLDLVAIDYLQLIRVAGIEREYEYVTHASKAMKSIAREYNIVNLTMFQLNREGGKKERPGMSDGKGSGSIEQDMDTIMLIHNPPEADGDAELILAKQRRGRTGTVMMDCIKPKAKFVDKGEKTWTEESETGWKGLPI
jgi:replicative DNA helicase